MNRLLEWHDGEAIDFLPFADDPSFPASKYLNCTLIEKNKPVAYIKQETWKFLNRNVHDDQALRDTADAVMEQYDATIEDIRSIFEGLFALHIDEYHSIMHSAAFYREWQDLSRRVNDKNVSRLEDYTGDFMLKHYCRVPDCRIPNCAHVRGLERARSSPVKPRAYFTGRVLSPATPCGPACYKHATLGMVEEREQPKGIQLALLNAAIEAYPSAPSCDLAIWCRIPCRQFHACRRLVQEVPVHLASDGEDEDHYTPQSKDLTKESATARRTVDRSLKSAAKGKIHGYPWSVPCNHEGPCSREANCICYKYKRRCQKWCGCDSDCIRKAGCDCAYPNKCDTAHCKCFLEKRECDLSVCHGGRYRLGEAHQCNNVSLQEGYRPSVTVKPAQYGWGLFADEGIKAGQFIGEYFGEYMTFSREDNEAIAGNHIGRSYAFAVAKHWSINSGNIGNETRFMNHDKDANVSAKTMIVNGDLRIGFFAVRNIKRGKELFLDYGNNFYMPD